MRGDTVQSEQAEASSVANRRALVGACSSAMRRSLWIGAGWTVENTIVFAIYVAVASHLWRTRGDWSDRGSAAAAAWTTPTIP